MRDYFAIAVELARSEFQIRERNDVIVTRYLRDEWMRDTVSAWDETTGRVAGSHQSGDGFENVPRATESPTSSVKTARRKKPIKLARIWVRA